MFNTNIKSMVELMQTFPDEQSCIKYLEQIIYDGELPKSPFDAESTVYRCKGNRYRCKNTGKYFNIKTGTMFDNTKMPLQKWFLAIWLVTSHKKGVSSWQLSRDLDITQKSAWFMLQRIRAAFNIENYNELEGTVEADEAFYGGRNSNRHRNKRVKAVKDRTYPDKVPIVGFIQRNGKMTAVATVNTKRETLHKLIKTYVKPHTVFITDDWRGYRGLEETHEHRIVKNTATAYRHDYDPSTHTNTVEGSWKIMKNSMRDMYNHVSRKHVQLYVDEFVYRYNLRQQPDSDKFNWLILNSGVRTKYKDLINGITEIYRPHK